MRYSGHLTDQILIIEQHYKLSDGRRKVLIGYYAEEAQLSILPANYVGVLPGMKITHGKTLPASICVQICITQQVVYSLDLIFTLWGE